MESVNLIWDPKRNRENDKNQPELQNHIIMLVKNRNQMIVGAIFSTMF